MKRKMLIMTIVFTCLFFLSVETLAEGNYPWDEYGIKKEVTRSNSYYPQAVSSNWYTLPGASKVHLSKAWTVEFSEIVTSDNVDGMVIELAGEYIPVNILISGDNNKATVTPVNPYKPNQKYTIKVFLSNGKKYKKDFITEDYGDKEPNNQISEASAILPGKDLIGSIEDDDKDFFRIEVKEEGRLNINVERYDDDNINLKLKSVDNIGKEILIYSNTAVSGSSDTSARRSISIDVEPGVYYIELDTEYYYYNYGWYSKHTGYGEYKLNVNLEPTKIKNDVKENKTWENSVAIDLNSEHTGHIMYYTNDGSRDYRDWYQIEVKEDGRLDLNVERYDNQNINLKITSVNDMGKSIDIISDETKTGDGSISSSRSINVDLEPGVYYIELDTEYYYYNYGWYSKHDDSGEYKLNVDFSRPNYTNDSINNDLLGEASQINLNSENTGHIRYYKNQGGRDNVDWYKIDVKNSGTLDIEVERYDSRNINLRVKSLNSMNKEEVLALDTTASDNSSISPSRYVSVYLEPGTYYIELDTEYYYYNYGWYPTHDKSGEYRLNVNFQ